MCCTDNNEKAKKIIIDNEYTDVIYYTSPSYYTAIIGVTSDNRVVYDYNLMVEYLINYEDMTEEDAVDWISYNTMNTVIDNRANYYVPNY